MATNIHKTGEDNFYRRAQLEAMIREEFGDLKVFESDDGDEWFVPNPQAYPDELIEKLAPINDQRKAAEVLIDWANGKGSWAKFKKAGGQSVFVGFAIKREQDRVNGETADGTPTD